MLDDHEGVVKDRSRLLLKNIVITSIIIPRILLFMG